MTAAATDQQIRVKRVNGRWPSDAASEGGAPGGNRAMGHQGKRRGRAAPCHRSQARCGLLNLLCKTVKLLFLDVINSHKCVTPVIHKQILELIQLSFARNNI